MGVQLAGSSRIYNSAEKAIVVNYVKLYGGNEVKLDFAYAAQMLRTSNATRADVSPRL